MLDSDNTRFDTVHLEEARVINKFITPPKPVPISEPAIPTEVQENKANKRTSNIAHTEVVIDISDELSAEI